MDLAAFEDKYIEVLKRIPGIVNPLRKLSFKEKLKWTGIILLVYYLMSQVLVYGINQAGVQRIQFLEIVLGSQFGSLITLGIGPIVSASIILQLLVGSKILPWDMGTEKGKTLFQGTQKLLAFLFAFAEAWIFVAFGAIPAASPNLVGFIILQLAVGGWILIFMDELISKWGFGSGVGLFIVAGVSKTIVLRMFNPLTTTGEFPITGTVPSGHIPAAAMAIGAGEVIQAFFTLLPVIATVLVFFLVIYAQSIRVEVPLAFGSVRGFGRRWPLKFFYTSNMPVILVAALLANVQLMARMLASKGSSWLGVFNEEGQATGGLIYYLFPPSSEGLSSLMVTIGVFILLGIVVGVLIKKKGWKVGVVFAILGCLIWYFGFSSIGLTGITAISGSEILRMFTYSAFMIIGAVIFSIFWVSTSGMDAKSVADQIQGTGLQIPGFRRDVRIIERVLGRYIPYLTVIGGAAVGALAAYADFTFALGTGTGILLATMIIYQMYEEISAQHADDMHPAFKRFFGKL